MGNNDDELGMDKGGRPKRRGKIVAARVPDDVYEEAEKRAEREGRSLGEILRSFLFFWAQDEYPSPGVAPGEGKRSKRKRSSK